MESVQRDGFKVLLVTFWLLAFLILFRATQARAGNLPVISGITNRSVAANTRTASISFTIGDLETPATNLVLSGSSSNPGLVTSNGMSFFGSVSNRSVRILPETNQIGTTTIFIRVTDTDGMFAESSFLLAVTNGPPVISSIATRMVNAGVTSAPISFTVTDPETASSTLTVAGRSSATNLISNQNIFFGGIGNSRTIQVKPELMLGSITITLTVTDIFGSSASTDMNLILSNSPPVVNTPYSYILPMNSTSPPLPLTVGDFETPASNLVVSGFSSVSALVPTENLLFGGSGSNRTLTLWPATNSIGTTTVSVIVSDTFGATATNQMILNVYQFVEVTNNIMGLSHGMAVWGDYDNDGYLDVLVTGATIYSQVHSLLYHNNGDGTFSNANANLPGVQIGAVAWGDYDGDGYLDFALAGATDTNSITRIYHNNRNGTFTDIQADLPGVSGCALAWGDYDNDGDLDLLVSGWVSTNSITKIFRNERGSFVESGVKLPALSRGAVAWGDYDNDGDLDILINGQNDGYQYFTFLLRNDGQGSFVDINTPLNTRSEGTAVWGDYDNDGDLDILVSGRSVLDGSLGSSLYRNDGQDRFVEVDAGLEEGLLRGVWGDYDNDGDLDLVFGSGNAYDSPKSAVYRNDNGNYVNSGNLLYGLGWGNVPLADYDNDGRLDILQTGMASVYAGIYQSFDATKLYRNYGPTTNRPPLPPGNLSASVAGRAVRLSWSSGSDPEQSGGLTYNLRVGTSPGSGDVVSSMSAASGFRRVAADGNVFHNLGWVLRELSPGTYYWSVQTVDHGFRGSTFAPEASFLIPAAPGTPSVITEVPTSVTCFDALFNGFSNPNGLPSSVWFDYGLTTNYGTSSQVSNIGNGTSEIAVHLHSADLIPSTTYHVRLVATNSSGTNFGLDRTFRTAPYSQFSELATLLPGMSSGTAAWGDVDNDNRLDLLLAGTTNFGSFGWGTYLLHNDGNGSFTQLSGVPYAAINGSSPWCDINNDGKLDLLLSSGAYTNINRLFSSALSFPSAFVRSTECADYDNDGRQDLYFMGEILPDRGLGSYLYHNEGQGHFKQTDSNLAYNYGPLAWGDYDNDGDLDALCANADDPGPFYWNFVRLFRNDTLATFTDVGFTNFLSAAVVSWGDFDNDGDLDIAIIGQRFGTNFGTIYRNDGLDVFTDTGINLLYGPINQTTSISLQCGDYDNDGQLDLLVGGPQSSYLLRNQNGNFVHSGIAFSNTVSGLFFGDYDNDGDLDIVTAGSSDGRLVTRIFRNNNALSNSPPSAPTGLQSAISDRKVLLSWDRALDANQTNGFTYNLRVGTTPGGIEIMSPLANQQTGWRRVQKFGNAGTALGWYLTNLAVGTYYWSVQAIDHSFAGSPFGSEASFVVPFRRPDIIQSWATNLTLVSGILQGIINPNGPGSSFYFEYGLTTNYTSRTDDQTIAAGNTNAPVSALIAGLQPTTTYHFRLVATNSLGSSFGPDQLFTTTYFTEISNLIPDADGASVAWGDFDRDGMLDLLISGYFADTGNSTRIYRNNGNWTFTDLGATNLIGGNYGSVAWGDYDNDGYLDILISGWGISKVYHNNGNSTFSDINANLPSLTDSKSIWGDFDNDGRLDILFVGGITLLYRNTCSGFVPVSMGLPYYVNFGVMAWGDYDNDGHPDLILGGDGSTYVLYHNDDGRSFSSGSSQFPAARYGSVGWGDLDNDNQLDVLLASDINGNSFVYHNVGGSFTNLNVSLATLRQGCGSWVDFNQDGWMDIMLAGSDTNGSNVIHFYPNTGGSFTNPPLIIPTSLPRSVAWGDVDNDGDLDLIVAGHSTRIYRNNSLGSNAPPAAPTSLSAAAYADNSVVLSWSSPSNAYPSRGLSYNLRIGTAPGFEDVLSPMAVTGGRRLLPALGNHFESLQCTLTNLRSGRYFWSVQTINPSLVGSAFAEEAMFSFTNSGPVAVPQSVFLLEDASKTITLSASNFGGLPLNFSILAQPSNGTLSNNSPDMIYRPKANYFGADSFSFAVSNCVATSQAATVSIVVGAVADVNSVRLSTAKSTNGQVSLILRGEPYERYALQASTDLIHWVTITNLIPTNTFLQFVDPDAANFSQRFYRSALMLTPTQIYNAGRLPSGLFQFNFGTDIGRNYDIVASTNLLTWVTAGHLTAVASNTVFIDIATPNFATRFYRVQPSR